MKKRHIFAPFGGIRPTPMERRRGRLMRAPDHGAGDGGEGGSSGGGSGEGNGDGGQGGAGGSGGNGGQGGQSGSGGQNDALAAAVARAEAAEAAAAAAREEARRFDGIDPEKARENERKVRDAEATARQAEKDKATAEGNFQRLRELQNEEHEAQLSAERAARQEADARATAATARANTAMTTAAFAGSNFILNDTILSPVKAARLFGDHIEIEGDEVVVYDGPRGQKRAKVMDARGNALPFDVAIKKVIEADADKDTFLKNKTRPGAGSKTENGNSVPAGKDRLSRLKAGLDALKANS